MKRIVIIGAGNVGSHIASAIIWKKLKVEIILVDLSEEYEKSQVLDLKDLASLSYRTKVSQGDFGDEKVSQGDIFIITAGAKQRDGESRLDLWEKNKKILNNIKDSLGQIKKDAKIIMVSNPVDLLTLEAQKIFNLDRKQIFGSGTFLDTLRLRWRLREKNFSEKNISKTFVLGEHGDSSFICWDAFNQKIDFLEREKIENDVRREAYEIIKGKGATFFGIGAAVGEMLEALILNKKKILPLSVYLEDEEIVLSLPVKLGTEGILKIYRPKFNEEEEEKFYKSVETLKSLV